MFFCYTFQGISSNVSAQTSVQFLISAFQELILILISKSFSLFSECSFFITSCYFVDAILLFLMNNFIEFSLKKIGLFILFY